MPESWPEGVGAWQCTTPRSVASKLSPLTWRNPNKLLRDKGQAACYPAFPKPVYRLRRSTAEIGKGYERLQRSRFHPFASQQGESVGETAETWTVERMSRRVCSQITSIEVNLTWAKMEASSKSQWRDESGVLLLTSNAVRRYAAWRGKRRIRNTMGSWLRLLSPPDNFTVHFVVALEPDMFPLDGYWFFFCWVASLLDTF